MSSKYNSTSHTDATGIEYLDGLYSYAMLLTSDHTEAEGLVRETYVRAMQAIDRLRAESGIKSWYFAILRNVWLNQLRKRRTTPQMIEIFTSDGAGEAIVGPSKDAHHTSAGRIEVRAAILRLPVEFREIILPREYEELSYQEIASVMDCPAGTVMSLLARAHTELHALLAVTMKRTGPSEGSSFVRCLRCR